MPLQVFVDNPIAWRRRAEPPAEAAAFRARLVALAIRPVAIHASYLVNLAGPEEAFFGRSVEVLAADLRAAPAFSGRFVNVHIGSHRGAGVEFGTKRLADGLALVLAEVDGGPDAPPIVLENSPGSGFGLGMDVPGLADIAEAAAARGIPRERLGFCLDTAHAWAAGIDLSEPAEIDAFLADFDDRIGLDRLVMIHLNDSKSERGSHLDRHEHLGAGRIGAAGLGHLIRHPALAHSGVLPRDPGDGRRLRRGQHGASARHRRRPAAGRPAARGDDRAWQPGADRSVGGSGGRRRVTTRSRTRSGLALALVPIALVVVAAILRLPNLATRGTWDADQGHDMLVLRALVRDGVVAAARAADLDRRRPPRRARTTTCCRRPRS